jgi:hypothetical protein
MLDVADPRTVLCGGRDICPFSQRADAQRDLWIAHEKFLTLILRIYYALVKESLTFAQRPKFEGLFS